MAVCEDADGVKTIPCDTRTSVYGRRTDWIMLYLPTLLGIQSKVAGCKFLVVFKFFNNLSG